MSFLRAINDRRVRKEGDMDKTYASGMRMALYKRESAVWYAPRANTEGRVIVYNPLYANKKRLFCQTRQDGC